VAGRFNKVWILMEKRKAVTKVFLFYDIILIRIIIS